jgi:hypothetical protein
MAALAVQVAQTGPTIQLLQLEVMRLGHMMMPEHTAAAAQVAQY